MNELATRHPRYGYRRIWALLRTEGWQVNRKRVERLWRLEGHRVPPRRTQASGKRAQGNALNAAWNLAAGAPNDVWSYDFTSARTRAGAPLRILNVVDEYTRLELGCRIARSIAARDVIAELERLVGRHGKPRILRSDNGREFIAASLLEWLDEQGIAPAFIERGSPQQNPFVERFNGTMRDEVLNGQEFGSVLRGARRRPSLGRGVQRPPPSPRPRHAHTTTVCCSVERGDRLRHTPLIPPGPVSRAPSLSRRSSGAGSQARRTHTRSGPNRGGRSIPVSGFSLGLSS